MPLTPPKAAEGPANWAGIAPDVFTGVPPKAAEGPALLAGFAPDVLTGVPPKVPRRMRDVVGGTL